MPKDVIIESIFKIVSSTLHDIRKSFKTSDFRHVYTVYIFRQVLFETRSQQQKQNKCMQYKNNDNVLEYSRVSVQYMVVLRLKFTELEMK